MSVELRLLEQVDSLEEGLEDSLEDGLEEAGLEDGPQHYCWELGLVVVLVLVRDQ